MKKLSFILALLMALCMTVGAFADGEAWKQPDPSLEIEDEDDIENIFDRFQLTDEEKANIFTFTTFVPWTTENGHVEYDPFIAPLSRAVAKITGFAQYLYYISGDKDTALQMKMATDDWNYDSIYGFSPQDTWVQELIDEGIVIPLTKYYNDPENYPWLAQIPEEVKANMTYNGEIYGVPYGWYVEEEPETGEYWRAAGWYINKNILAEVGMTLDDITTIEGIENFARAVKEANLTTADGLPVIPISGGEDFYNRTTLANTWGVTTSGYGYGWYDGELINWRQHDQTKEAMRWFHKMWQEGLVDEEFFSQSDDILCEKLLAGRVAILCEKAWSWWSVVTVGHNEASDSMIPIVVPKVEGVEKLGIAQTYATLGNQMMMVTESCADPDRLMKCFDFLERTDTAELNMTISDGPRGLRWDCLDDDVSAYWYLDNEWTVESGWDWNYKVGGWFQGIRELPRPFFFNGNQTEIAPNAEDGLTAIFWVQNMHIFNKVNKMDRPTMDLDLVSFPPDGPYGRYSTLLNQIDLQYMSACITADDFDAAWDVYENELESQAHISEINAEFIELLDAYQQENAGSSRITELVSK